MTAFQDALRQRLATIDTIGREQTTWERLRTQRAQAAAEFKRAYDFQSAENSRMANATGPQAYGTSRRPGNPAGSSRSFGNSSLEQFINSIGRKESSNNYNARNRDSGAMGKYQIMPSNLGGSRNGWDYEALGYDVSAAQFMRSPQIQEQIARYKLQQYYNKYGSAGAAIAWYAGPSAASRYQKTGYVSQSSLGKYPSVQAYVNSILGR